MATLNWNGGEPNNVGNEDATEIFTSGFWNDIPEATIRQYVVEYEASAEVPEPSTLLLLGTGLVGLVGYGRRKRKA